MSDSLIPPNNIEYNRTHSDEVSGYKTPSQNVSSPQSLSIRETPILFAAQQRFKRRGPYDESSPLSVAKNSLLNINSNRLSFLNQSKNISNPSPSALSSPKQALSNGKSTPYKIASSEKDKKRLVEQFYNTFNDTIVSQPNDVDISAFLRHSNLSSANGSPTLEKSIDFDRGVNKDKEFSDLVNYGGLTFRPFDQHLINDENLTNYLLNIDTFTNDLQKENKDGKRSLEPLSNVIEQVQRSLLEPLHKSMSKSSDHSIEALRALEDLENLGTYIKNLHESTNVLLEELQKGKTLLKEKYKREISENIERLNQFIASLEQLEHKLDTIKNKISANKEFMANSLNEKIAVLEFVNHRYIQHSKEMRYRRLKQLNIGLAALVVILGIYYYYYYILIV